MTREEAIENLKFLRECSYVDTFEDAEYKALDMAIECLSAQNEAMTEEELAEFKKELANAVPEREKREWIPIEVQMPEMGKYVLCACQAKIYDVLKLTPKGWFHDVKHTYMLGFVLAWQPLPEPYKGGEV